jgi:CRISPR-associated endonuclease/helicase Cas3
MVNNFFNNLFSKKIEKIINFDLFKAIAKTNGTTLIDHTENVAIESKRLFSLREEIGFFEIEKNKQFSWEDLLEAICLHDIGKSFNHWQNYAKNNDLKNVDFRHEFAFLPFYFHLKNINSKYHIISSVAAHHNNLSIEEKKYAKIKVTDQKLENLYNKFSIEKNIEKILIETSKKKDIIKKQVSFDDIIKFWYFQAFYRYFLQISDRRASTLEIYDKIKLPTPICFLYNFPFQKFNSTQKIILENSNQQITFLRAPAGGGKSAAAMLWSQQQIKNKKCDRVIMAMPTIFTSNVLSESISEHVGGSTVVNSTSKFNNKDEFSNKIEKSHKFSWEKSFESHITICTIDQLLHCMTLTNEHHQGRLFNICNSCIIIDELDFYDDFVIANIAEFLKLLNQLSVPVLIMSATIPQKIIRQINTTINEENKLLEDSTNYERDRINIKKISKDFEKIITDNINRDNIIIYANTIKNAKKYYEFIKKIRQDVVIYHSEFTNEHKNLKEKEIVSMLGKKTWQKIEKPKGVVIMTQIGELSIDISSDVVITEIAPMDRIVQRFGRCNRFNDKCGEAFVVIPHNEERNVYTPMPYGSFDVKKNNYVENKFLKKTRNLLKKGNYNYTKYIKIIDEIYKDFEFSDTSLKNSKLLQQYFINNWFFNGKSKNDDGEENNTLWKSRNIDNSNSLEIIIEDNEEQISFENFDEFNFFAFMKTLKITINNKKLEKLKQEEIIKEKIFYVKNLSENRIEEITKYVLNKKENYSYETGFKF